MMRALILLAALAMGGCMQNGDADGRCDLSHSAEIVFSRAGAPDTVTTRAFGASCDKAIGLFTVVDAEGYPLWSWTVPLARAFGDVFPHDQPEHMQIFLEQWATPAIGSTQAAPAWEDLSQGQTTLDRLTYEDIRVRDLPMLCHFAGTDRQLCVFWEPAAGGAGLYYEHTLGDSEP